MKQIQSNLRGERMLKCAYLWSFSLLKYYVHQIGVWLEIINLFRCPFFTFWGSPADFPEICDFPAGKSFWSKEKSFGYFFCFFQETAMACLLIHGFCYLSKKNNPWRIPEENLFFIHFSFSMCRNIQIYQVCQTINLEIHKKVFDLWNTEATV